MTVRKLKAVSRRLKALVAQDRVLLKALVSALAEMCIQGVSTRKVKAITEELCGHSFPAAANSAITRWLDEALTKFARRKFAENYPYLILGARYEKVCECRGDIIDQIIAGNVLGASVTAYAYLRMRDRRFRRGSRHTGDEHLFWMDLARRSGKIASGDRPKRRYGSGVNIHSESSVGQENFLAVIIGKIQCHRRILDENPMSSAQREFLNGCIRRLRGKFTRGPAHHLRVHGRLPTRSLPREPLEVDSSYPLTIRPEAPNALLEKVRA